MSRMHILVGRQHQNLWLSRKGQKPEELAAVLCPFPEEAMRSFAVGATVKARIDTPERPAQTVGPRIECGAGQRRALHESGRRLARRILAFARPVLAEVCAGGLADEIEQARRLRRGSANGCGVHGPSGLG